MSKELFSEYRGKIQAIDSNLDDLFFCTIHGETDTGYFYQLDPVKNELLEIELPSPATSIQVVKDSVFVGTKAGSICIRSGKSKTFKELSALADFAIEIITPVGQDRLGCAAENTFWLIDQKQGKILQTIEIEQEITSVAVDPTGEWLAVGQADGTVSIFDCEENGSFQPAESATLHQGAVTALLFEPEELRFFSAGSDQKLLLTHARGSLEPEDRGRGNSHQSTVTAMINVQGERFVTGSKDKTCKSWARAGASKPQTLSKEVIAVVDLALIKIHKREHLAVVCNDNTIRVILLETSGRFDDAKIKFFDAFGKVKNLLGRNDTASRGEALNLLADMDDSDSLEILADQVKADADHGLRKRAAKLLCDSGHSRSTKLLEPLLKHDDGAVRTQVFDSLLKRFSADDLHPIKLALSAKKEDVGVSAIEQLESLAQQDDIARNELIGGLNLNPFEVREAALLALETVYGKASSESGLLGLQSRQSDVRRLALIRFFQLELLSDEQVLASIRRCYEDKDAQVRQTAFLISVLARPQLTQAIRQSDENLHRHLHEVETFQLSFEKKASKKSDKKLPPQPKPKKIPLEDPDFEPLISAMASRANDTCLLGASSLATLGDSRPFGLLLQLSRSPDAEVRVQVCQALGALFDPRANGRLETLASDDQENVRDAAFSALTRISERADTPLVAADAGLGANYPDVRKRGLQLLVAYLRASKDHLQDETALELLSSALNDSDAEIHGEAHKATVNLKVGGSEPDALRFLLHSVRPEVRREVLNEVIADKKKKWAWEILTSLFNDPDSKLRKEAYDEAVKQTKSKDIDVMRLGLESTFADVRLEAIADLKRRRNKAAQEVIATAISDPIEEVRLEALDALVDLEATEAVQVAIQSEHVEVRMMACCARAVFGDPACVPPLLELVSQPEPLKSQKEARAAWQTQVVGGLEGLAAMGPKLIGDVKIFQQVYTLVHHADSHVRRAAAMALQSISGTDNVDLLKESLQHEDDAVRQNAAMALAIQGDTTGAPILFSGQLDQENKLIVAELLGEFSENQLVLMLDDQDQVWRNAAFCVLMLRELVNVDHTRPRNCLAALSAQPPRLRLAAAGGLQALSDQNDFEEFFVNFVNDRGENPNWKIKSDSILKLAAILAFAERPVKVYALRLLKHLAAEKQSAWNFAWEIFETRFEAEIKAAEEQFLQHKSAETDLAKLNELAFGTYVGLVREEVQPQNLDPLFGTTVIGIRCEALRRLQQMVDEDQGFQAATIPVLVQSLGDPLAPVRQLAFHILDEVGASLEDRAAAAIECGHTDLAVDGLKLLTTNATGKKSLAILEKVIRSRSDQLAIEAAKLLEELEGKIKAASIAIESPNSGLRTQAVGWLAEEYDQDSKAQKALQQATNARYDNVRMRAAIALADQQDSAAYDALVSLVNHTSKSPHRSVVAALCNLDHPDVSKTLVQRVQNDPEKTANVEMLFDFVGEQRDATVADLLLEMIEEFPTFSVVRKICGYDQPLVDPLEKDTDRSWIDQQHPRNHELFARLIGEAIQRDTRKELLREAANVQWSPGSEVDDHASVLCGHADEDLRRRYVQVVSWRCKHRGASIQTLQEGLKHRDQVTQFLAAEGLALVGEKDGLNVLMSAVELLSDLNLRKRAVLALGELADIRALDLIIRLATDQEHALRDVALQAAGHLKNSDQSDKIFELLTSTIKKNIATNDESTKRALTGLRLFDSHDAWSVIRQVAWEGTFTGLLPKTMDVIRYTTRSRSYEHVRIQDHAVHELGFDDSVETHDLLLALIEEAAVQFELLFKSSRRSFGEESLEPDYAILKSDFYLWGPMAEIKNQCAKRVCESGDSAKIFEVLPDCNDEAISRFLVTHLLGEKPLPVEDAAGVLTSESVKSIEIAARIIGKAEDQKFEKPLSETLVRLADRWNHLRSNLSDDDATYDTDFMETTSALKRLCWALGRCGGEKSLVQIFRANRSDHLFEHVRIAAIQGLAKCKLSKKSLDMIKESLHDTDPVIRRTVARILATQAEKTMAGMAEELLADRGIFNVVARQTDVNLHQALQSGVATSNYQSVALPHMVEARDITGLAVVANDPNQKDSVRFGAVEGIATILDAQSESELVSIGTNENYDKEIRKVAWRGLRRLKRAIALKKIK